MTTQKQRTAFPIYAGLSAAMALLFLIATFVIGDGYTLVDRIGGALWVMFLSLIITMVIVIPRVNRQNAGQH